MRIDNKRTRYNLIISCFLRNIFLSCRSTAVCARELTFHTSSLLMVYIMMYEKVRFSSREALVKARDPGPRSPSSVAPALFARYKTRFSPYDFMSVNNDVGRPLPSFRDTRRRTVLTVVHFGRRRRVIERDNSSQSKTRAQATSHITPNNLCHPTRPFTN